MGKYRKGTEESQDDCSYKGPAKMKEWKSEFEVSWDKAKRKTKQFRKSRKKRSLN